MIIKDDNFPLADKFDIIIPVGITHIFGSEPRITFYDEAYDAARWLASLPEDKLFDDETLLMLDGMLQDRVKSWGYSTDKGAETRWSHLFRMDSRSMVNKGLILPSSEPLMPGHGYENLTECEPDPEGKGLLCFGTVTDGKILSAASENPHGDGDTMIDIGVETAPEHRGKGYGSSNVAALAYYLLDPGITISYISARDNNPSVKLAKSVGFIDSGREFQYVCYLEEN